MILFNIFCYLLVITHSITGIAVCVAWCKIAIECAKEETLLSLNFKRGS